jgi:phosphatidate cytidylyltransferase
VLRARIATAAVAIPALLALILYAPPWLFAAVVAAIAAVGIGEYATMAFPMQRGERVLTIILGVAVIAGAAWQADGRALLGALTLTVSAGLVWTLLARSDFEHGLRDLGLALVGILYTSFLTPHFIWLHGVGTEGPLWVIFVLVIGMAGDTGGYTVGHALGRHKLAPRISPGKSVEGAIGIVAASLLGGAVSKLLFLRHVPWAEVMLLSAIMAIIGQLGDLSESIMKRTFGVKESGWLFPGHGGVLDRLDSLLFPVAFLYYYIVFDVHVFR